MVPHIPRHSLKVPQPTALDVLETSAYESYYKIYNQELTRIFRCSLHVHSSVQLYNHEHFGLDKIP